MTRLRPRSPALIAALVVFVLAAVALTLKQSDPPLPVSKPSAVAAARADTTLGPILRSMPGARLDVARVDDTHVRLVAYEGEKTAAQGMVGTDGTVREIFDFRRMHQAFGSLTAQRPLALLLLAALFVGMTAVWPIRRMRNLDVAVMTATIVPVLLLNARDNVSMTVAGTLVGGYLAVRAAWTALRRPAEPAPSVPLFDVLTRRVGPDVRARLLRMLLAAVAVVSTMLIFGSTGVIDVAWAVLGGGTQLVHGHLPYGNVTTAVHGDTYPILSYVVYAPVAALFPVRDNWDSADPALWVAIAAMLFVAWALRRRAATPEAGDRAAIAWLACPPVLIAATTGTTDVVLAAMLVGVVLLMGRPTLAAGALAFATGFKLVPVLLFGALFGHLRGNALRRAALAAAAVGAASASMIVALGGLAGIGDMLHAMGYQFSRVSDHSVWRNLGIEWLQPIAQAGVLAFVVGTAIRVRRDAELAADPARVAALLAAILLGVQLTANYWVYLYLAWPAPLLFASLLRDRQPQAHPAAATEETAAARPARTSAVAVVA